MEDSETQQPVDSTQQMTSKTPATRQKIPKRVAAGKAVAEKTKQAREAQKKVLSEAQIIIANNQLKQTAAVDPPAVADPPPPPHPHVEGESTKNVLTSTQWLSVISIIVSFAGIYYKREEIKGLLTKKLLLLPCLRLLHHRLWIPCRREGYNIRSKKKSGHQSDGLKIN